MAGHPLLHTLFHSLASLGYIPFALTSVFVTISTPYVELLPIAIILLAFVPPLTLFPLLCFTYRRLEKLWAISLTVQRAKAYIILAGCGLCILVGIQLLLVHLIATPLNSRYNASFHKISPPIVVQDQPTVPSPVTPQDLPQQQQQPLHVLPSNAWVVPGTGAADASPLQSSILIDSLISSDDLRPPQQASRPPSSGDEASWKLFHSSTEPIFSDVIVVDPRHLQRRQEPRNKRVAAGVQGAAGLEDESDKNSDSDGALPTPSPAGVSENRHRGKSPPIPIKAPIPTYLLPGPPRGNMALEAPPPSLSTEDLGGPLVVNGLSSDFPVTAAALPPQPLPPVSPLVIAPPEAAAALVPSGATPRDNSNNAHTTSEAPQRKKDNLLLPHDILTPVLLLGAGTLNSASQQQQPKDVLLSPKPEPHLGPVLSGQGYIYPNEGKDSTQPIPPPLLSSPRDPTANSDNSDLPQLQSIKDGESTPLFSTSSGNSGFYTVAGFFTVLFVASQVLLIGLLSMLFLGVLILTEFVLDREDDDLCQQYRLYWARGIGIGIATVFSAINGSMLSTYILLDGESDWISKAVVGSICFYWVVMTFLMKCIAAPPSWEC